MLQKRKYFCRRINSKSCRYLPQNQSGFAYGLLSFKYWVLRHDAYFLAENLIINSADRNNRNKNSHHHFYHFSFALPQHYYPNQVHS